MVMVVRPSVMPLSYRYLPTQRMPLPHIFPSETIGVEDAHLRIRLVGRRNKDNAVAADTEVRFTELDRKRLGIGHSLVEAIKIDIIVAAAVHLGESQLHTDSLLRK